MKPFLGLQLASASSPRRRLGIQPHRGDHLLKTVFNRTTPQVKSESREPAMVETDAEPLSSDEYSSGLSELSRTPDPDDIPNVKHVKKAEKVTFGKARPPAKGTYSKFNVPNNKRSIRVGDEVTEESETGSAKRKKLEGAQDEEDGKLFSGWGESSSNNKRPKLQTTYAKKGDGQLTNIHATPKASPKKANLNTTAPRASPTIKYSTKKVEKIASKADIKPVAFTGSKNSTTSSLGRITRNSTKANDASPRLKLPQPIPPPSASSHKNGKTRSIKLPSTISDTSESTPASSSQERKRPGLNMPNMGLLESSPPSKTGLKMPNMESKDVGGSTSLSSAPSSIANSPPPQINLVEDDGRKCPVCGRQVDYDFYTDFFLGKPQNMKQQVQFCRAHKKRSAEEEYRIKGYPIIDWEGLESRLHSHNEYLRAVIDGSKTSYYKKKLGDKIAAGKDRTALEIMSSGSWEMLSPGYYGTKGAKIMDQYITDNLASELRRFAPIDKIIAARGVSGYIQSVLVPELATLLVMDDLKVSAEKAREVLNASRALGDQVNEVAEDIMPKDMMASQMVVWEDGSDDDGA